MKPTFISSHIFRLLALFFILSVPIATSWAAEQSMDTEVQTININTADAEKMANSLSGIGLKKAELIVQWREQHGSFTNIDQLTNVKGIGEKTLAKNSGLIRLE